MVSIVHDGPLEQQAGNAAAKSSIDVPAEVRGGSCAARVGGYFASLLYFFPSSRYSTAIA